MTSAGFPHSETLGSQLVCQLPEDYRRLQRPSSAPSAKASTNVPLKTSATLQSQKPRQHAPQQSTHKSEPLPATITKQSWKNSKMLASTMQFSNNQPSPTPPTPPGTGTTGLVFHALRRTHRSLRTQQRARQVISEVAFHAEAVLAPPQKPTE